MSYSARLDAAFAYAHALHRRQCRKGSPVPYITHLMAVAAAVGESGGTEDQVIAALLHDAVEDQGGQPTLAEIRRRFGDGVANLVLACSDTDIDPKPPWRARKEQFLASMRTADPAVRLIVAADKLHNAQSLTAGLLEQGPNLWDRFSASPEESLWYYAEAVRVLREGWDHPLLDRLALAVDQLHRTACDVEA